MWGILCKAYAEVQKFSQALDSNPEADLPDMQEDLAMAFATAKAMVHFHKEALNGLKGLQEMW
jgi:hypothetical protein